MAKKHANTTRSPTTVEQLQSHLRELRLPTMRDQFESEATRAAKENRSYAEYPEPLTSLEIQARTQGRIRWMAMASRLPSSRTWDQFQWSRLSKLSQQQLQTLPYGAFLGRRENVLIFGKPGSGNSCCEVARCTSRPVVCWYKICWRRNAISKPERFVKKLAGFEALLTDDLGYVQQSREEMEVLFTLLSERYERGSLLLTSNLPISGWGAIFKDPMTTAAAIDRLVHHSVIVELNVPSIRLETAKGVKTPSAPPPEPWLTR